MISPRIVSAAMLMDDDTIIVGIRHYSPEMRVTLSRIYGKGIKLFGMWLRKPYHLRVVDEGFVDQFGKFYNRKDAWKIAEQNQQIRKKVSSHGTLYSENLY